MTPTDRLKQAYAMNNIPWDHTLAWLPTDTQLREAEHWEERATGPTELSLKIAKAVIETTALHCGALGVRYRSGAHRAIRRSERQYNG